MGHTKLETRNSKPETIHWHDATLELPDDDLDVLLATQGGEVFPGFRDAGEWRHYAAEPVHDHVTHWADFPAHPAERGSVTRSNPATTEAP